MITINGKKLKDVDEFFKKFGRDFSKEFNELFNSNNFDELFKTSDLKKDLKDFFETKTIPVNVYRTKEAHIIEALVPGTKKEHIEVNLKGDEIQISIPDNHIRYKTEDTKSRDYTEVQWTRSVGSARIKIDDEIHDKNNISSSLTDGILTITLPFIKKAEKQTEKTTITIN